MRVSGCIHQIKIDFNITPEIKRFVHIYLIEGEKCYLIDTGVAGSEKIIEQYMSSIGRDIKEIDTILLTHAHPDHIGAAAKLKELTGCKVLGCLEEKEWIENIEKQFADRPIPNFYGLLNQSVKLDKVVLNDEAIQLEPNITIRVIDASGHSWGSKAFLFEEERALFTGDTIPLVGDIPIYVSKKQSVETLEKLGQIEDIHYYCSAWAEVWDRKKGKEKIKEAHEWLEEIDRRVKQVVSKTASQDKAIIFNELCKESDIKQFSMNPLFRTSVYANIDHL